MSQHALSEHAMEVFADIKKILIKKQIRTMIIITEFFWQFSSKSYV